MKEKIVCKRCGCDLLLQGEVEVGLCSVCQEVINRPPLIEHFSDEPCNEPTYFVDDLYCLDYDNRQVIGSGMTSNLVGSSLTTTDKRRKELRLAIASITVIFVTLFAAQYFLPRLIGLNGLDLLVAAAMVAGWLWWLKEVKNCE
jgi:hypothetical protein